MTTGNNSAHTALADWIDDGVIAQVILGKLEEEGISPTLENGQKVWLDSLEELHHLIAAILIDSINRGALQ